MRSLIAVTVLAGCWGSKSPEQPKVSNLPALPACPVELRNQHLFVGTADLGEFIDEPEATTDRLTIYQTGDEAWVSYPVPNAQHGPAGHDTMWKVSCKGGTKLDALTIEGADFGHAALHPDRKRLYYSTDGGVVELDLATKTKTPITKPGTVAQCWMAEDEKTPTPQRDSVLAVTADYLEFERGAPCGFEGEWDATAIRFHFATKREEQATPVSGAAMVGDSVLLAVEHGCKSELIRSADWKTWTPVAGASVTGAATLVSDGSVVLAVGSQCGMGQNGDALVSRDGGKTWTKALESQVMWIRGSTIATLELAVDGGEHTMKWDGKAFVDSGKPTGDDGFAQRHVEPSKLGDRTVELTQFGLVDAKTKERLYPR